MTMCKMTRCMVPMADMIHNLSAISTLHSHVGQYSTLWVSALLGLLILTSDFKMLRQVQHTTGNQCTKSDTSNTFQSLVRMSDNPNRKMDRVHRVKQPPKGNTI